MIYPILLYLYLTGTTFTLVGTSLTMFDVILLATVLDVFFAAFRRYIEGD